MRYLIHWQLGVVLLGAALVASGHAMIYKRDSRSATLWTLVIWLLPGVGPALYVLLGINRVRRSAVALRGDMVRHRTAPQTAPDAFAKDPFFSRPEMEHLRLLERMVDRVASRPLLPGNRMDALAVPPQGYAAMVEAIDSATVSVGLASYIFDGTGPGEQFVEALVRAKERGVEVRILIDAVGARYSRPSVDHILRRHGIPVALFNQRLLPFWLPAWNLRNHRKILVVDGVTGFTGGMNIKREYGRLGPNIFHDLHFRLRGPAVAHLSEVFADDWQFTAGEALRGAKWFPELQPAGETFARGIEAGPDENFERLRWVLIGALNAAKRSVQVITPYFLPDPAIISALDAAALRGVEVDIILPEHSNLPFIHWAAFGQLRQVLYRRCRVWLHPGSFDHSKLMVVDGAWMLIGSANWDARSLRLNFEFGMECYSAEFGRQMEQLAQTHLAESRPLTLEQIDARPLPVKLRDGFARLFAPYL
ncbi:MAG TPA: phospholipase D-like domain-containing protein [Candidatus Methylacidiphilales bacterium]|nr:phospholipase D-like domain-containing protein [Candidatus Methylacidiphilales bacterium]